MPKRYLNLVAGAQQFQVLYSRGASVPTMKRLLWAFAYLSLVACAWTGAVRAEEQKTQDVNYLTIPATGFWSSAGIVPEAVR